MQSSLVLVFLFWWLVAVVDRVILTCHSFQIVPSLTALYSRQYRVNRDFGETLLMPFAALNYLLIIRYSANNRTAFSNKLEKGR